MPPEPAVSELALMSLRRAVRAISLHVQRTGLHTDSQVRSRVNAGQLEPGQVNRAIWVALLGRPLR
jgi:hypothetical protein